jgi:hypothetical protein
MNVILQEPPIAHGRASPFDIVGLRGELAEIYSLSSKGRAANRSCNWEQLNEGWVK